MERPDGPALAAQLRASLAASGETLYAVAKRAGVSYPVLYRFAAGQRGLNLETVEALAKALGLTLAPKTAAKAPRSTAAKMRGLLDGALDQLVAHAISGREPTEAELDRLERLLAAHRAKKKRKSRGASKGGDP